MNTVNMPIFLACWVAEGEWEVRVDGPHQANGQRHVHIRRKRGRKGEYSWNADGSRHDKHRFPVNEGMITRAKVIAAGKLRVPVDSLQMLTNLPTGGRVRVMHEGYPFLSETYIFADRDLVILVSEEWLVIVSADDENEPA
ncbi:DUF6367 family protein [Thiomicrorhabdus sp.]|uniref:DUF6367 family protein n=1 Tax=Thiomicrorhabdus sp. TaxID=2039724 RepID=UPI0029C667E3|nr:DUF6367 family protein [Thiomicrorhabdus sp.]